MFGIPVGLIVRVVAIAALIAAVVFFKSRYDHSQQDIGYHKRDKEVAELQAQLTAARTRAANLVLEYQAAADKAALAEKERDEARKRAFGPVREQVAHVVSGPGIRIPPDVSSVWQSAVSAANGASDGAATGAEGAAIPAATEAQVYDERELAQWFTDAAAAYVSASDDSLACRERYEAARQAQINATEPRHTSVP